MAIIAAVAVGVAAITAYMLDPAHSGAYDAAAAVAAVPHSHTIALLEEERQQMIDMSAAARTLSVVAKPKVVSPTTAPSPPPASNSSANSSASNSSGGTSAPPQPVVAVPNPGTAKSIAYNMMASFGFSPSGQFGCLDDLWTRESNWMYDAENASGAYGIPQALPGSKMANVAADWRTDPTTQIRWGLGYIKSVYGSPCAAWDFELANGYY